MLKKCFEILKSTHDRLGIMTMLILFGLENVMRVDLICHSSGEHGKVAKKNTLKLDETQSEYSLL